MTDPIADLLTRIRNAVSARQNGTVVPYSKLKVAILDVMKKRNFIFDYTIDDTVVHKELKITFNKDLNSLDLKRISKPGRRVYVKKDEIKPVVNGYGISIISTSHGIITGNEAYKKGLGGEYLCEIW